MQLQSALLALMATMALAAPSDLDKRAFSSDCKKGGFKSGKTKYTLTCDEKPRISNAYYRFTHTGDYDIEECAQSTCNKDPDCYLIVFNNNFNQLTCDVYGKGATVKSTSDKGDFDYAFKA